MRVSLLFVGCLSQELRQLGRLQPKDAVDIDVFIQGVQHEKQPKLKSRGARPLVLEKSPYDHVKPYVDKAVHRIKPIVHDMVHGGKPSGHPELVAVKRSPRLKQGEDDYGYYDDEWTEDEMEDLSTEAGEAGVDGTGEMSGDATGDATGGDPSADPTGDPTGDMSGDMSGEATGDMPGEATGDPSGDMSGDATGGDATGDMSGDVTVDEDATWDTDFSMPTIGPPGALSSSTEAVDVSTIVPEPRAGPRAEGDPTDDPAGAGDDSTGDEASAEATTAPGGSGGSGGGGSGSGGSGSGGSDPGDDGGNDSSIRTALGLTVGLVAAMFL